MTHTIIGKNTTIGKSSIIGGQPQYVGKKGKGRVVIGENTTIGEFCTVNLPVENIATEIGNNCFISSHSHIAHDCIIGDDVIMASGVMLAGHVTILKGAFIGLNVCVHQFVTIGAYSIIGMGSAVHLDIPPFVKFYEGKVRELNTVGLKRAGFSNIQIQKARRYYQRKRSIPPDELNEALKEWHAFRAGRDRNYYKLASRRRVD